MTVADDQHDPFGDLPPDLPPGEKPEGYTILRGRGPEDDQSEEAQGRRCVRHLLRIQQAQRLSKTRRGALEEVAATLEADLKAQRSALAKLDEWRDRQCAPDKRLLDSYFREAPQYQVPARPRNKALDFGGIVVETKQDTKPAQITLANEGEVMAQFPDFVVAVPKLEWARLKRTLTVTDTAVVSEDGEVVSGVFATPKHSEEKFTVLVDGARIPLTWEVADGDGTDGTDGIDEARPDVDPDDPFGE